MMNRKIFVCLIIIGLPCVQLRIIPFTCPSEARWSSCSGCKAYCQSKGTSCPAAACEEGCVCLKKGYRIYNDSCIPAAQCPTEDAAYPIISCPPEAEVSECTGCWSECPVTWKKCSTTCVRGCRCQVDDYVLHNGACIPRSQCPYIPLELGDCPTNMVWKFCSDCDDYCPVLGQKCIKTCRRGCVCRETYLMYFGTCIYGLACPQTFPFVKSCSKETKWMDCAPCKAFCFPDSRCDKECVPACVCENMELVRYNGRCIPPDHCPALPLQDSE